MNLEEFHALQTSTGAAALARAAELNPTDATLLACASRLRLEFPPALATAALETAVLRKKASLKFSRSSAMFFTREALEQSSSEVVSRYRAERFASYARVADLCCGIGGDAIGLSQHCDVTAIDADPLRVAMARANVDVYGNGNSTTFVVDDVLKADLSDCNAFFADPDRRADGKRHIGMKHYQPGLDQLRQRLPHACPLGVKIAPGIPHHEIDALDAEAEFISVNVELKECVLWFGPFRSTVRRATLLPNRQTIAGDPLRDGSISEPGSYLYDPDPAVVRAGLVRNLGDTFDATLIDPDIAFLTADHLQPTPFATAYRIDEVHAFHLKKLTERLRSLKVGQITVIKRGSAVDGDTLTRRCKLEGPEHRVVILTMAMGRPVMLIGNRVSP